MRSVVSDQRSRRPWLQFTLRTLLLTVGAVSLICALVGYRVVEYRREQNALSVLREKYPFITWGMSNGRESASLVAPLRGASVSWIWIQVADEGMASEDMRLLCDLTALRRLDFSLSRIGKEHIGRLPQLTQVEELDVQYCLLVGDAEVAELCKVCPNLRIVSVAHTGVSDGVFRHLARLRNLERVDASWTRISGVGLKDLGQECGITVLELENSQLNDSTIGGVAGLTKLKELSIAGTSVTSQSVPVLSRLTGLERLTVSGTGLTARDCADLRARLLSCEITGRR